MGEVQNKGNPKYFLKGAMQILHRDKKLKWSNVTPFSIKVSIKLIEAHINDLDYSFDKYLTIYILLIFYISEGCDHASSQNQYAHNYYPERILRLHNEFLTNYELDYELIDNEIEKIQKFPSASDAMQECVKCN